MVRTLPNRLACFFRFELESFTGSAESDMSIATAILILASQLAQARAITDVWRQIPIQEVLVTLFGDIKVLLIHKKQRDSKLNDRGSK